MKPQEQVRVEDLRKNPRLSVAPVGDQGPSLELVCDLGTSRFEAEVSDVSAGGIGLVSPKPIPRGALVRLALPGAKGPTVWAEGRWAVESGSHFRIGLLMLDGAAAPPRLFLNALMKALGQRRTEILNKRRTDRWSGLWPTMLIHAMQGVSAEHSGMTVNLGFYGATWNGPARVEPGAQVVLSIQGCESLPAMVVSSRPRSGQDWALVLDFEPLQPAQTRSLQALLPSKPEEEFR